MKTLRHIVGVVLAVPFAIIVLALTIVSSAIKLVHTAVYYAALGAALASKAIINFFE